MNDPNVTLLIFLKKYKNAFDSCFPLKEYQEKEQEIRDLKVLNTKTNYTGNI